jgi:cell division septum initiation protein DivIVA
MKTIEEFITENNILKFRLKRFQEENEQLLIEIKELAKKVNEE